MSSKMQWIDGWVNTWFDEWGDHPYEPEPKYLLKDYYLQHPDKYVLLLEWLDVTYNDLLNQAISEWVEQTGEKDSWDNLVNMPFQYVEQIVNRWATVFFIACEFSPDLDLLDSLFSLVAEMVHRTRDKDDE